MAPPLGELSPQATERVKAPSPSLAIARATSLKAPLCKGGCQKSLIFDWGIVDSINPLLQPLRPVCPLGTSPYTGEAYFHAAALSSYRGWYSTST